MPLEAAPQPQKEPVGAMIGIGIILIVMIMGAVYLWHKQQEKRVQMLPYIPDDSSTTIAR